MSSLIFGNGGDVNAVVTRGELPYSPLLCIALKTYITDNNLNPTYYKRQKAINVAPFENIKGEWILKAANPSWNKEVDLCWAQ